MKIKPILLNEPKYIPKIWSTLLYIVFVAVVCVLFAARNVEDLRFNFIKEILGDYFLHISNFSITFLLILVSGFTTALFDRSLKITYIYAALMIIVNVIYELYLPFINTRDKIDAYYGIVGAILPFAYLIPYKYYGLQENPKYNPHNENQIIEADD